MVGIFQKLLLFDCRITLYNSRVFSFRLASEAYVFAVVTV